MVLHSWSFWQNHDRPKTLITWPDYDFVLSQTIPKGILLPKRHLGYALKEVFLVWGWLFLMKFWLVGDLLVCLLKKRMIQGDRPMVFHIFWHKNESCFGYFRWFRSGAFVKNRFLAPNGFKPVRNRFPSCHPDSNFARIPNFAFEI